MNTPELKVNADGTLTGTVATIVWDAADLYEALAEAGYEQTADNVMKLINDKYFLKTLRDMSVSNGWETMSHIVSDVEGLTKSEESDAQDDN